MNQIKEGRVWNQLEEGRAKDLMLSRGKVGTWNKGRGLQRGEGSEAKIWLPLEAD